MRWQRLPWPHRAAWPSRRSPRGWRRLPASSDGWNCAARHAALPSTTISPTIRRRLPRPCVASGARTRTLVSGRSSSRVRRRVACASFRTPSPMLSKPPTKWCWRPSSAPTCRTSGASRCRISCATSAARGQRARHIDSTEAIVETVAKEAREGDLVVVMSNGGFDDIHARLLDALRRGRGRMSEGWRLAFLGDAALSVHVVEPSPLDANACVHRLARRLRGRGVPGVRDIVPGMRELVVHVDPLRCDVSQVDAGVADDRRGRREPNADPHRRRAGALWRRRSAGSRRRGAGVRPDARRGLPAPSGSRIRRLLRRLSARISLPRPARPATAPASPSHATSARACGVGRDRRRVLGYLSVGEPRRLAHHRQH